LARLGCPECGCKKFSYTMPEELAQRVKAVVPV
jgi:predicted  nucleic acid-binding Zn-ribbon protein